MVLNEYEKIVVDMINRRLANRKRSGSKYPRRSSSSESPPVEQVEMSPGSSNTTSVPVDDNESFSTSEAAGRSSANGHFNQRPDPPSPPSFNHQGLVASLSLVASEYVSMRGFHRYRAIFVVLGTCLVVLPSIVIVVPISFYLMGDTTLNTTLQSASTMHPDRPSEQAPASTEPPKLVIESLPFENFRCHDAGRFSLCNDLTTGACIFVFNSFPPVGLIRVIKVDAVPEFEKRKMQQYFERHCLNRSAWYRTIPF